MLQVGTRLHGQVLTLALGHVFINVLEYNVLEADSFRTGHQAIQIQPTYIHIHYLAILQLLKLEHVISKD